MDQTTTEQTTDTNTEPTDADLIAAAQEAGGAASVDVEAEAAAAGAEPPAKETPADAVESEPKIAAVLRAREKAFAERQQAEDYAAQLRAAAEQEAAQMRAAARAQAEREYQEHLEAQKKHFRENPTEHLRTLAKDPQEIVDAVLRDGTPEARAMREMQEQIRAANERAAKADKVAEEFNAWKSEQQKTAHAQRVAEVKQTFLSTHANPEQTPYLNKRYDADEIFEKADALARKWQAAQIPFDHAQLAEYLEWESRKRIVGDTSGAPPQQVSGVGGSASKVKANGSRTLSAANGSERRASPKPIDEMSPEEERNALIEAVREARRQNGG